MADLTKDIQYALAYIEANLTRDLEVRDIAKQAYLSPFYFQRIFGALCGISVGEYIRSRRLSLAGEELASSDAKVIDVAAKYGYESPDSFNRAFQRFHGISPSAAKKAGARLISFASVKIKQKLEGVHKMTMERMENSTTGLQIIISPGRRFPSDANPW